MGFFDFFKKKKIPSSEVPIPEEEKKFYQPDSYYTQDAFQGTMFARPVVTFEERKKTTYPSKHGLYPAEIMLLKYCTYGTYPLSSGSYPGLWWFQYGIRNVIAMLKSLEERGFICYAPAKEHISRLKVAQLKELLAYFNLPVSGKKADLVERLQNNVADADLEAVVPDKKYMLTPLGEQELAENEYVPYMHSSKYKTLDGASERDSFTVWDINRELHKNPNLGWKEIVANRERQLAKGPGDDTPLEEVPTAENKIAYQTARHRASVLRTLENAKDSNASFYVVASCLDLETCPCCGRMDGQRFPISDKQHLPPYHEGCRCWIYSSNVLKLEQKYGTGTKTAFDPSSWKKITVPSDMSYAEWRKKYVEPFPASIQREWELRRSVPALTEKQQRVYSSIKAHPGILQSDLPKEIPDLSKSAVIYALDVLVSLGYIEKRPVGRSYALHTTGKAPKWIEGE